MTKMNIRNIIAYPLALAASLFVAGCDEFKEDTKIRETSCAIEIVPYGTFRVVDSDRDGYADGFFKVNSGNQQSYPNAVREFNYVKPGLENKFPGSKTMDPYMQIEAMNILRGCNTFRYHIGESLNSENKTQEESQEKRIGVIGLPYTPKNKTQIQDKN